MEAKVGSAAKIASNGAPVYVVEVGSQHALEAMKGNVPSVGTLFQLDRRVAQLEPPRNK